jgi:hypothetical protein
VTDEDDFSRFVRQSLDGSGEPLGKFFSQEQGGRRELGITNLAGRIERRTCLGILRLFASHIALVGELVAESIDQPLARDHSQPGVKRHVRVTKIIGQPTASNQECLLNHVAGIQPASNCPIQAAANHSLERFTVTVQQLTDRVLITLLCLTQQDLSFASVGPHNDRLPQEMRGEGSVESRQI